MEHRFSSSVFLRYNINQYRLFPSPSQVQLQLLFAGVTICEQEPLFLKGRVAAGEATTAFNVVLTGLVV